MSVRCTYLLVPKAMRFSTVAVLGRGAGLKVRGLGPLTFSPGPQFFHRLLILPPPSALGGSASQNVLARTATGFQHLSYRIILTLLVMQINIRFLLLHELRILLSASLYVSKRGAYLDRLCRDVVGRWLVGRWLSRACTVAKRYILGL